MVETPKLGPQIVLSFPSTTFEEGSKSELSDINDEFPEGEKSSTDHELSI